VLAKLLEMNLTDGLVKNFKGLKSAISVRMPKTAAKVENMATNKRSPAHARS
jgi:hypothetical protein